MGASVTIAASNPAPFTAALRSVYPAPVQLARWTAECNAYNSAYDQSGGSASAAGAAVVITRTELDKQLVQGRGPYDPVDIAHDVIAVADIGARSLPGIGFLLGLPVGPEGGLLGFLLGKGGQNLIETVTKDASDLIGTPLASDYVTQQRAISGFSATMDLVGATAPQTEGCAARLTQILATDPEASAAAAIAWPDLAQGKAAIDPSAGAVVNNFKPVFSSTTLTVNADNSVVINDIDQAKTDINAAITASTGTVTQGIDAARSQLNQILDIQKTATGGQQDILRLLQGQALSTAQAQAVETARAQAAATLTTTWQAAHGIVTGAAAIASLFGDTALARQITQVGSAVITVAQSVAGLVDAAANLSKVVNAVSALGTAAATGKHHRCGRGPVAAVRALATVTRGPDTHPNRPAAEEHRRTTPGHVRQLPIG